MTETGAASIHVTLSNGNVTVRHGDLKVVLAQFNDVPKGSWDALWSSLYRIFGSNAQGGGK